MDLVHPIVVAAHHDGTAVAVDGQVARLGQGVDDGEVVFGDGHIAGAGHFAKHIDAHIDILYGDDGFTHQFAGDEAFLDIGCHLLACHALYAYLAQHGKVDGALFVHGVGDD